MIRTTLLATALSVTASIGLAAPCITDTGSFGSYKQAFGQEAANAGIGQQGLQALNSAGLSDITWRFESRPSSQTGVSYGDPAEFLARRTQASADAFVGQASAQVRSNPNLFASLEQQYGVPGSILATIWGLETNWGGYLGQTPIVAGSVTLASYCRRHPRFESHALAALQLVDRGVITANTRGGPSGELGHMQFLAGNWARYGVDANGDGKADPYNATDALASAANMLRAGGWQAGQPFGEGTPNFNVLSVWNDSGNYQRAIAYAAERIGG